MNYVKAEKGTTCEWLDGKFNREAGGEIPCYAPATVCDLDSDVNEPGFYCQPHAEENQSRDEEFRVPVEIGAPDVH